MVIQKGFENPAQYQGGIVSIGNFDGVHKGHQQLMEVLVEQAKRHSVPAVVLTFEPHPLRLLRPDSLPPRLTTLKHKAELLRESGIDCVIAYPTTRELLSLNPTAFFEKFLVESIQARGIVEGPNFYFGKNRQGTTETLRELAQQANIDLTILPPSLVEIDRNSTPSETELSYRSSDVVISSSLLRSLIRQGEFHTALKLLGHPYRLSGSVETGAQRGQTIGFPTANLSQIETLIPAEGVYAARAFIEQSERNINSNQTKMGYPCAVHIGPNPTFGEQHRKVEAHLLDFNGNLYEKVLHLDLAVRLRDIIPFVSVEELKEQLQKDIEKVRSLMVEPG